MRFNLAIKSAPYHVSLTQNLYQQKCKSCVKETLDVRDKYVTHEKENCFTGIYRQYFGDKLPDVLKRLQEDVLASVSNLHLIF